MLEKNLEKIVCDFVTKETDTANALFNYYNKDNKINLLDTMQIARAFQFKTLNRNNNLDIDLFGFDKNNIELLEWANAADGVPLLAQLITTPHLIVDLRAISGVVEFHNIYGVTISQFKKLMEKNYIVINILENNYERYYENINKESFIYNGKDYLSEYISLFEDFEHCKINSIRKKRFMELYKKDKKNNKLKDDDELFKNFFSNEDYEEMQKRNKLRSNGVRMDGISLIGLNNTVRAHYKYSQFAEIVSTNDISINGELEYINTLMKQSKGIIKLSKNDTDILDNKIKLMNELRGIKNCYVAKYIASMGGIYNFSGNEVSATFKSYMTHKNKETLLKDIVEPSNNKNFMMDKSFIDLIKSVRCKYSGDSAKLQILKMLSKNPLTDENFNTFLDFIENIEGYSEQISLAISKITQSNVKADFYDSSERYIQNKTIPYIENIKNINAVFEGSRVLKNICSMGDGYLMNEIVLAILTPFKFDDESKKLISDFTSNATEFFLEVLYNNYYLASKVLFGQKKQLCLNYNILQNLFYSKNKRK